MQVSLKWLKDYVDIELSAVALAEQLTMAGLEVDSLREVVPGFSGIRVARILTLKAHPGADRLSLCDVTTGNATCRIVCGAKNIKVGDIVPLAPVGAILPGGDVIRRSQIRGEVSEGMLCSEEELGIGDDATGIMLLPSDLSLGADLADVLNLGDTVLDIGVTPNRSDCLSMVGVAREIAAITGKKMRYPLADVIEGDEDIRTRTSVSILDPDLCPRYTARIIKNVTVGASPVWMKQRLEAVGLRSINNIVDVTNFVMMELGQPLHAFDFRFLDEGRIVVRRSRDGEKFVSLDGKERILRSGTLMICDGVKAVAIGGVMGGLNSEVKEDSQTIFLESAYFNPPSIRRTSRALAMGTDASFRFERGIDPEGVIRALDRAACLMAELAGGTVLAHRVDEYPQRIETPQNIPLRLKRVHDILGTVVPELEVIRILQSLEMAVEADGDGRFRVTPPSWRIDIAREIDLIEEIARLHGYDSVPAALPCISVASGVLIGKRKVEGCVRSIMTGVGYSEVINYSFISPDGADRLGLAETDERRNHVRIRNPLTEEQAVLRTTMAYSLLLNAKRNADGGRSDLKLFEIGKTFIAIGEGEQPRELNRLACLITGLRYADEWHSLDLQADFYDLKGCVENILDALGIASPSFRAGSLEAFLHPGKSCGVFSGDEQLGFLGEVHPDVLARMDMAGRVVVCELDLDLLAARFPDKEPFRAIPRLPSSSRDVAFLVRRELEAAELLRLATDLNEELLEKVKIFDVYEGKNIPGGMKSLGLHFSYRSAERTLTDEEVNEVHARIVRGIIEKAGVSIR